MKTYNLRGKTVVHFLQLLSDEEMTTCEKLAEKNGDTFTTSTKYMFARNKARPFHGKKFHNKDFGGGIAFPDDYWLNKFKEHFKID